MARANRLSARTVDAIKVAGRHADGGNLYLSVSAKGAKSWVFLYMLDGRQREMGLGPVRDISLAEAREIAAQHRRTLRTGVDPLENRRQQITKPTFGAFAQQHIETMESRWRNEKHRAQWRSTLKAYAGPIEGRAVDSITTTDVLGILKPIWSLKPETASRVRGRIESVLDAAKAAGFRSGDNPAAWRGHLDNLLPARTKLSRGHFTAMPIDDVPAFMVQLRGLKGVSARALEFLILTATRTGETIKARWSEFDLGKCVWTIPPERMKAGREHRVPLSDRAVEILRQLEPLRTSEHVFPGGMPKAPLSGMALTMALRRLGVDVTVHGFRSTFRDWASERTATPHEVCEMALAHVIANKAEAAYRRGDLFEKRRALMDAWAFFIGSAKATDPVVPLERIA